MQSRRVRNEQTYFSQKGCITMSNYIYEKITNNIIKKIEEENLLPWQKGWSCGSEYPMNWATKRNYRGINTLILAYTKWDNPYWLSEKQGKLPARFQVFGTFLRVRKHPRDVFIIIFDRGFSVTFPYVVLRRLSALHLPLVYTAIARVAGNTG